MKKNETKEVKTEETVDKTESRLGYLERTVSKMKNVLETVYGHDIDGDGKVGSMSIKGMLITVVTAILTIVGVTLAEDVWVLYDGNTTYGTAKVTSDLAGECTLTVDKVAGDLQDATGNGTVNTAAVVVAAVTETYIGDAAMRQTTLTLVDCPVSITGNHATPTNGFGGVKLFDFPAGEILIHGCVFASGDLNIATNFVPAGSGAHISFGTVTAQSCTGTVYQTGTSADFMASINVDPYTNNVDQFTGVLGSAAYYDGTATAKDLYLNVTINEDDIASNCTAYVDGTFIFTWSNLGDK